MNLYYDFIAYMRFQKMMNYQPKAQFIPKRSTVIKNKQRAKRSGK